MEKWLLDVEAAMFESVHAAMAAGAEAYARTPRDEWVLQWPGMVALLVTALYWTEGATAALQEGSCKEYEKKCTCVPFVFFILAEFPSAPLVQFVVGQPWLVALVAAARCDIRCV